MAAAQGQPKSNSEHVLVVDSGTSTDSTEVLHLMSLGRQIKPLVRDRYEYSPHRLCTCIPSVLTSNFFHYPDHYHIGEKDLVIPLRLLVENS